MPCWLVRSTCAEKLPGFAIMILDVTLILKLWSWWYCTQWLQCVLMGVLSKLMFWVCPAGWVFYMHKPLLGYVVMILDGTL